MGSVTDVLGRSPEARGVVAEDSESAVVLRTQEPAEAGCAAAVRSVPVTCCASVAVVDGVEIAEWFATDQAAATLSFEGGGNLQPTQPLALRRGLPWISGA